MITACRVNTAVQLHLQTDSKIKILHNVLVVVFITTNQGEEGKNSLIDYLILIQALIGQKEIKRS